MEAPFGQPVRASSPPYHSDHRHRERNGADKPRLHDAQAKLADDLGQEEKEPMIDARSAEIRDAEPDDHGAQKQIEKTMLVDRASLTCLLVQTFNQPIPLRHAKP